MDDGAGFLVLQDDAPIPLQDQVVEIGKYGTNVLLKVVCFTQVENFFCGPVYQAQAVV